MLRGALILVLALSLGGCSLLARRAPVSGPQTAAPAAASASAASGTAIAAGAAALIGTPYEFGGADVGGFDCSGLALYVYERAGISIPRTAAEQQRAALPVPLGELMPGDLVFFRMRARHIDHVGIYLGDGRFVHAPHRGVAVASADLSGGFYARHLVSAGRFERARVSSP